MKKTLKSLVALILAAAMLCSLAGCSSAKNVWSAKCADETLSIGTYIYFLAYASSEAANLVEDKEKSVLSQKVDGKDAATWIKDQAKYYVEYLFAVKKMMDDRKLSLTADELSSIKVSAKTYYSQMAQLLSKYGVAESSFERVVVEETMAEKVFEAIYGEGGEIGSEDKVLADYYESKYTSYDYAIITLSKKDSEGNSAFLKGDELESAVNEIKGWVEDYNSGKIDKEGFVKKYEASDYFYSEELEDGKEYELIEAADLTESLKSASKTITETEVGKACLDDYSASGYLQVSFINDIKDKTQDALKDESTRHTLLHACYKDDFEELVKKEIENLSIEYNTKEIDKQDVKKFF